MIYGLSGPHEARVVSVTDGDTIRADVKVGTLLLGDETLSLWAENRPVRLAGCNAAEKATDGGKAAKANLTGILTPGTPITLTGVTGYKYGGAGELVAGITLNGVDLVALLISQNWLAPWNGAGPRPVPPWPRPVT